VACRCSTGLVQRLGSSRRIATSLAFARAGRVRGCVIQEGVGVGATAGPDPTADDVGACATWRRAGPNHAPPGAIHHGYVREYIGR
jgi:hypothetical protein